ncbi:hypothetical protein GCK72_014783 [Caenorhabditis remanei]|uniref:SUN domain-containing protein n=1 Tax=Caenorhabditis remanei TaxID=31234 RepID=A0A6A5GV05_CAERE|nr:hypothetical protein GCK72_014783 [Caenorhabditis remanei]KAF1758325.1 hypothetical protein GCK72_014783 [Caenorhabditis remanei]
MTSTHSEPGLQRQKSVETQRNTKIRYEWIKQRVRRHMILELFVLICIVLVISKLHQSLSQNERNHEFISNIQSELKTFKLDIESKIQSNREDEKYDEEVIEDFESSSAGKINKLKKIPEHPFRDQKNSLREFPGNQMNAASLILGATVDSSRSSSSDNNPFFGRDQSGYVLIDRFDPPSDKAWCSNEENPILTIDLAKYIRPISVSYQHSKWSGIVPDGAPRRYDVFACLDYYCNNLEPLVSNCEYRATRDNEQEQFCSIPFNKNHSSIGKIQFHFRQNHGNVVKTCAHTIRVQGEAKKIITLAPKTPKEAETCRELTYDFRHNSFTYHMLDYKSCEVLYLNECCEDCPECCNECFIKDMNSEILSQCALGVLCALALFSVFAIVVLLCFAL